MTKKLDPSHRGCPGDGLGKLDREQTVELDASDSSPGTAEIETFEWDVGNEEAFDKTGETIEVTITACGEFPVTLRVTDTDGASDTEEIVLSTE